MSELTAARIAG